MPVEAMDVRLDRCTPSVRGGQTAIHHDAEFARASGAPDLYANILSLQGIGRASHSALPNERHPARLNLAKERMSCMLPPRTRVMTS